MGQQYAALTYKGDLTGNALEGQILGHDEDYHPYEVSDVIYDPETDTSSVHIQYATEDGLKNYLAEENRQTEILQSLYRAGLTSTTEAAKLSVLAQMN